MTRSAAADKSTRWICVGDRYGGLRGRPFPRRWFGSGATLTFEELTVVGPAAWDEYLTQLYGDYMTPPPPHRRVRHHQVTELHLEPEGVPDMPAEESVGRHDEPSPAQ